MEVIFYRTAAGSEPVREYFAELPLSEKAAAADAFSAIRKHGFRAPGIVFRHMQGKLWEFRVLGTVSHRVFYVSVDGPTMVLLHAFKKQGQKTPIRELRLAVRRMKETLNEA